MCEVYDGISTEDHFVELNCICCNTA